MNNIPVQDVFNRSLQDLRISVTDRCNFRCTYCMPKEIFGRDYAFMPKKQLLSFEEIKRLAALFVDMGIKKIRLTGGEPLLRKNLPYLIDKLVSIDGLEDIGLTTNGVLLASMVDDLKKSGLKRVNVSLDAINGDVFKRINNSGIDSNHILHGIDIAKETGLEVKINMVVKKGMNDQEILPMAAYFKERGITLRFIEFMDVGQYNGWNYAQVLTKKELYAQLSSHYELEPVEAAYRGEVAKRYRYCGTNTEVGFISSVSESFCSNCTRGRISADGKFFTCLFATSGFDVREMLRSNMSDSEIKAAISGTWKHRDDRYSDERTEETTKQRKKIEMSYIGG